MKSVTVKNEHTPLKVGGKILPDIRKCLNAHLDKVESINFEPLGSFKIRTVEFVPAA